MITLYDLGPVYFEDKGLSPYVRTIRYSFSPLSSNLSSPTIFPRFALNYKKIPYKDIQIPISEVKSTAKSVGAPPTSTKPDGSPKYTVPFIYDSTTGKLVSDSFLIAEYLDEAYPDTPRIVPLGMRVLQAIFCQTMVSAFVPIYPAIQPATEAQWMPKEFVEDLVRLDSRRSTASALSVEEEAAAWGQTRAALGEIALAYGTRAAEDSAFVMGGSTPTYADIAFTSFLWWVRTVYGEDSEIWGGIGGVGEGIIGKLCQDTLAHCKE
ncbi:hypothetical protein V5O48_012440 [Marasmius crinis-equi]|uniref:GST N-terminal domain-containing protein n=1 Tax=Marasmius crinis-equi TaxID=585013 RepID=A0ABR3F2S8_9AGAR